MPHPETALPTGRSQAPKRGEVWVNKFTRKQCVIHHIDFVPHVVVEYCVLADRCVLRWALHGIGSTPPFTDCYTFVRRHQ